MRIPVNISEYISLLDNRIRFLQANYGDGEWSCILGHSGRNCNGEEYLPNIQEALIDTLVNPAPGFVMYGSNGGPKLEPAIVEWLVDQNLTQRAWVYKEIISGANVNGKLKPFIAAVRRRRTMLVGPEHLNSPELYKIFNIRNHVIVPTSNAFTAIATTLEKTISLQEINKFDLILVSSGMAANPLIHKVGKLYPRVTIIDMGAVLDPYAGVWSRSGYRKSEFQEHMMANNLKDLPL